MCIRDSINGANVVNFTYDADGLLSTAGSLALSHNLQNGLYTGSTLGSVSDSLTYDNMAQLANYSATFRASGIYSAAFVHDAVGRISQKTESIGGATAVYDYSYDLAGRLTSVTKNSVPVGAYAYDSNGNRIAYTGAAGPVVASYDAQDRLISYGATTYSYTANGELLNKASGSQITGYQYDALGNLMHVVLPNGTTIDYLIDGRNRRIGKKINGVLTQGFLYKGSLRPIAELDGANALVSQFVYATHINVPDYMIKGGITYRLITDQLGSPRLVVDVSTGAIAQEIDYDEFGNVLNDTSPGFQPFGFAGGLYDHDTGLVRFGARDYDAGVGRWTAKDPIGFGGGEPNLGTYVGGNPISFVDPLGLAGWGFNAGGSIEWGVDSAVAAQASTGFASFFDTSNTSPMYPLGAPSAGVYTSSGAMAGATLDQNVGGASAGLGLGCFITNAKTAEQLRGPFDTWTLNLPIISFQYASGDDPVDGNTWTFGVSFGKSWGSSLSHYSVVTTYASTLVSQ